MMMLCAYCLYGRSLPVCVYCTYEYGGTSLLLFVEFRYRFVQYKICRSSTASTARYLYLLTKLLYCTSSIKFSIIVQYVMWIDRIIEDIMMCLNKLNTFNVETSTALFTVVPSLIR